MPSTQRSSKPAAWLFLLRSLLVLGLCVALISYAVISWHWPLIHDMQVLHYVSFLMDHGWAPYRQIGDMNMPGAYLFEGLALHSFGSSDLGWRFYDFFLSLTTIASAICIARRYDWIAGFVAGASFALVHGAEGPSNAGQRDQLMAVLLLVSYALCFEAVRRRVSWLMGLSALCSSMAASVKPTMLLAAPLLLVLAAIHLRRERVRIGSYVVWFVAGCTVAVGIVLVFLVRHGSLHAFVYELTHVLPHYAKITGAPWKELISKTLPRATYLYVACALATLLFCRDWCNWEHAAVLGGIVIGLVNFYGQRKGFSQHRYTTLAFVLLWSAIQLFVALRSSGFGRWIACCGLVYLLFLNTPNDIIWMRRFWKVNAFNTYLERDLTEIGTDKLQHSIQCLDLVDGCLTALYHLQIVQSTGSTGDLLLFLPQSTPVVNDARSNFLSQVEHSPPNIMVLSNAPFQGERTFHIVQTFPALADFMKVHYELRNQREFCNNVATSEPGTDSTCQAYRIYELRANAR